MLSPAPSIPPARAAVSLAVGGRRAPTGPRDGLGAAPEAPRGQAGGMPSWRRGGPWPGARGAGARLDGGNRTRTERWRRSGRPYAGAAAAAAPKRSRNGTSQLAHRRAHVPSRADKPPVGLGGSSREITHQFALTSWCAACAVSALGGCGPRGHGVTDRPRRLSPARGPATAVRPRTSTRTGPPY